MTHDTHRILPLVLIGAAAGILSGLFGIGGGTIIVPALVMVLGMPQRLAAGTSVAAILPTAIVGALTYALRGDTDWIAAIALAVGIVIGAQIGSHLLAKLPTAAIQWAFMIFLVAMIVSLWLVVPKRDEVIQIDWLTGALLVLTGVVTGTLSGILGVGGGIIVVPVLMFFFGANDLVAKGTSLLMMIPGSISGTIANAKRQNVDLRSAIIIGLAACVFVPFSSALAALIEPSVGNMLFSLFLVFILAQMLWKQFRKPASATGTPSR